MPGKKKSRTCINPLIVFGFPFPLCGRPCLNGGEVQWICQSASRFRTGLLPYRPHALWLSSGCTVFIQSRNERALGWASHFGLRVDAEAEERKCFFGTRGISLHVATLWSFNPCDFGGSKRAKASHSFRAGDNASKFRNRLLIERSYSYGGIGCPSFMFASNSRTWGLMPTFRAWTLASA